MGQVRRGYGWAAVLAAACLVQTAPPAGAAVVLDDGHVDYGARMVGGELQSQVKDGTGAAVVWREPAEVLFSLGPEARTSIPQGSKIDFLGPPGTTLWMIPQVQREGVLWAGWNTEELGPAEVNGSLAWRLDAVEGPGRVAVFQTGSFGQPDVLFDSGDGLPDTRAIPLGVHAHGNWAFTSAGEYRLTFTMSAERVGGGIVTDTETLAVRVQGASSGAGGQGPGGGGTGTGGGVGQDGAAKPALRLSAPRLRGRLLALSVKLPRSGRVSVTVRRAGRAVARTPTRRVGAEQRRLRFRLAKQLRPGRYRLAVRARAGDSVLRKTIAVRAEVRR